MGCISIMLEGCMCTESRGCRNIPGLTGTVSVKRQCDVPVFRKGRLRSGRIYIPVCRKPCRDFLAPPGFQCTHPQYQYKQGAAHYFPQQQPLSHNTLHLQTVHLQPPGSAPAHTRFATDGDLEIFIEYTPYTRHLSIFREITNFSHPLQVSRVKTLNPGN